MDAHGQVVRADNLIAQVYGTEAAGVSDAALSQLVKRLRVTLDAQVRKLMHDSAFTCIETIRNVGYRLNG